jgi:arsenate reductase
MFLSSISHEHLVELKNSEERRHKNMGANTLSSLSRGFRVLCAAGMLLNVAFGQVAKPKVSSVAPTVLFVCEHGAAKSVIAAAYFDKLAKDQHLPHRAVFRGVNPDATLSSVAEKGLKQDGIDTSGWKPARVTQRDVDEASRIATLGCVLPAGIHVASKVTDWGDIPSPSQNYSDARDQIKKRVRKLVDDLANEWRAAKEEAGR